MIWNSMSNILYFSIVRYMFIAHQYVFVFIYSWTTIWSWYIDHYMIITKNQPKKHPIPNFSGFHHGFIMVFLCFPSFPMAFLWLSDEERRAWRQWRRGSLVLAPERRRHQAEMGWSINRWCIVIICSLWLFNIPWLIEIPSLSHDYPIIILFSHHYIP
jgi:hypothetical protein